MNDLHEANRRYWNETHAGEFKRRDDETGIWRQCGSDPDLAFDCPLLDVIREFAPDLARAEVGIVGSGNNFAAFALAALGARVTSIDQSERQLAIAAERADALGLAIDFVRCDAADLSAVAAARFDLVCSTNGFFVWIADLDALFGAVARVLKPGGLYAFYDIHPFQRPWGDMGDEPEVEKPYYSTGPFCQSDAGPFYFHWTVGDLLNALADAGLSLRRVRECPPKAGGGWDGTWYLHAGLPAWLLAAAQKQ